MSIKLDFDLENVLITEFGVGRDDGNGQAFVFVPVDNLVRKVLCEIAIVTWNVLQNFEGEPSKYEPAEKHSGMEHLYLPLTDTLAESVRELYTASNLNVDASVLSDPGDLFCYFARLTDNKQRCLVALRRASQFKGVLKCRNRLVRMLDDTLKIIEDSVFKLDSDFDLLIDASNVHILRPSSFEFAGQLQQAILGAVPENVRAISKDLQFVEFGGITDYAGKHPRAARYLASIRAQAETKSIDKSLLKKLCKQTGVEVVESKGRLAIASGQEMEFLEVLDRRRYEISLIKEKPERYRAASRKKING